MSENLTWIVPCRRAVVKAECTYKNVLNDWYSDLEVPAHGTKLVNWYALPSADRFEWGLGWLSVCIERLDPLTDGRHSTAMARSEANTLNSSGAAPWVRLWKGPFRILHRAHEDESWWNNDRREVVCSSIEAFRDFRFLPGDVIEFPLFKFLGACYRRGEGQNTHWWGLRFNGDGSFFLGNSVVGPNGQPPAADADRLHDNMLAMRFQLLLGMALAAFYHGQPVFTNTPAGRSYSMGNEEVYGRGFIYTGTCVDPGGEDLDGKKVWRVFNHTWVFKEGGLCYNIPDAQGLLGLAANAPVTPGWSCSPCTLFLLNFLGNIANPVWEGNCARSVRNGTALGNVAERIIARIFIENKLGLNMAAPLYTATCTDLRPSVPHVAVISLNGHEIGMAKLFPHDRLMDESQRPFTGLLAAYNPLTGETSWPQGGDRNQGELHYFEAPGRLKRITATPAPLASAQEFNRFGCSAFKWERVSGNQLTAEKKMEGGAWVYNIQGWDMRLDFIELMQNDDLLGAFSAAPGSPDFRYRPIVIRAFGSQRNRRDSLDERTHIVGNYLDHYAKRALPSPTMGEVANEFASHADATQISRDMRGKLEAAPEFTDPDPSKRAKVRAFTNALVRPLVP